MKIILCIKPIRSELIYSSGQTRYEKYLINPYDLFALEKCLSFKRNNPECTVTCLSMGPMSSSEAMTRALAMGADQAILLNDNLFAGSDTIATTYILTKAVEKIGKFDMVACGKKAVDGETGQVVFSLAESLGLMCISDIEELLQKEGDKIILRQRAGEWDRKIEFEYPALISFNDFKINQPSIPLLALKRAKKKGITIWNAEDLRIDKSRCGLKGSKTELVNVKNDLIKKDNATATIEGSVNEKAHITLALIFKRIAR